uniref:hypothetical protein n=1 Tax=Streptomyces sp. NBC_01001 TaxID=2903713 RepID=UPI002F91330D|nr:hypothetical protein OG296_38370 [Streptomyces sp. NBC_01001]
MVMVTEGLDRFTAGEWVKAGPMTLVESLRRVFNGQMVSYSPERRAAGLALDVLWVDSRCLRGGRYRQSEESARAGEEAEQRRAQEAA